MSASNLFVSSHPKTITTTTHRRSDQETRGIVVCSTSSSDSGPVVPTAPLVSLLERLQHTALLTLDGDKSAFDPKSYVDMSLKPGRDLASVQSAFDALGDGASVSRDELTRFVGEYFDAAGEDLVRASAGDFAREPEGFLPRVGNREVREWALEVHGLWEGLIRRVCDDALERSHAHTLLPITHRVVVPGSRFREVYYWDSYWIVRGLLASKMYESAKSIVTNLISFVEEYGFVLNGARAYYTNRSQPPLLSAMVREIFERTKDVEFVRKSLPSLIKEHHFWTSGIHGVTIKDSDGCDQALSRYYAMWNKPRPESSTIDEKSATKIINPNEKKRFYREVASAAESGWDFSSRWMRDTEDLTTLRTTSILPVDLNAFILGMELNIVFLAKVLDENDVSVHFSEASQARKKAMESIFWNEEMSQWLDYCLDDSIIKEGESWNDGNQNHNTFASNFIPLWIESFHSDTSLLDKVMTSLQDSGLVCDYGIATSLTNSGEQWDFPNGWAPIQHMIIEGLARSGSNEARKLAEKIAMRWIKTNYVAYKKTGTMHEKYNVEICGDFGGGGEYVPQTGFGWSNGVVLALLEEFGWPEDRSIADY